MDEKKAICEQFPNIHIVRTVKQKSKRHRYYMEEQTAPMRLLRRLRGEPELDARRNNYRRRDRR